MKAIITKYLPATNIRGSRIKAKAEGVPAVVISYPDEARYPHHVAALELCKRMNWEGDLICGGLPDQSGNVYVFADDERIKNPHVDTNKTPGRGYQPKTGAACSCRPGNERDNCPRCEGTGHCIDFAAIRARRS